MITVGTVGANPAVLDTEIAKNLTPAVGFGPIENVTVAGKTVPVPPETIVTPSPGLTLYKHEGRFVNTVKVPRPPFAGMMTVDG
jgi:hypothetical protein